MTWYNPKSWFAGEEKSNPAQSFIGYQEGTNLHTTAVIGYQQAFEKLETVNRGTHMIVNACASMDYDVKDKATDGVVGNVKQKTLERLLNYKPNPYQSIQEFRANIFTDFILEGNIFIYYDGVHMYHLPAAHVNIKTDQKTFVSMYTYNGIVEMLPNEVIHIKDVSAKSIYRGTSRLVAANRNIEILSRMQEFQNQFFENGAVAGLIFTSENTLSQQAKDKTIAYWTQRYSPKNGAKRPIILDSGLKPVSNLQESFQEMDFDQSIKTHDSKILKALGVPPILLDGGNNANISPNLRLFYLETIVPITTKFVSAIERFFGYDVLAITSTVSALQPELKDVAAYHSTLVNAGILTPNEARIELRYTSIAGGDELRVPANIAGSASNPSEGGAPKKPKEPPSKE